MDVLYPTCVKTPKGIEEVERKVHGLALKSRQVLIMIDGKRDLAALQEIFPPAMVPGIIDELLSGGFIRELEPPKPPVEPPPAKPATRVPTAGNDEERYTMARNFMVNTVSSFVGLAGSSLIDKIEQSIDLEALAPLYHEWRDAIALSGDGKKRLFELEAQLIKLLGEPPPRTPAPAPMAPKSPPPAARPADDDERLSMARNFMINTTNTFIGLAGSALIEKVERAASITELRHLYYDWKESLQLDKAALARLPDLEKRLAALLS